MTGRFSTALSLQLDPHRAIATRRWAAFTDAEGVFEIVGLPTGEARVWIEADGAAPTQTWMLAEEGVTTQATFRVGALERVTLLDAATGGTVSTADGLTLVFPPGSLADADGAPVPLVSNGMVSVRLSRDGAEVQPVEAVEISFPTLGAPEPACGAFQLYGFDEASGVWTPEEGGAVVGDRFVASVEHFSYWNCDVPASGDGCIDVTLERAGSPVAHQQVGVWVSNGTAATPTTDTLGAFRVQAPPGATVTLGVVLDAAGEVGAETADTIWSIGPINVPEAADGCADVGTVAVTGVDQDGDGQPVQPWGWECDDTNAAVTEPCPGESRDAAIGESVGGGNGGTGWASDTACPWTGPGVPPNRPLLTPPATPRGSPGRPTMRTPR